MIGTILLALGMMTATTTKKSIVFYEEGLLEEEYYFEIYLQKFDEVQAMGGLGVVIASKGLCDNNTELWSAAWDAERKEGFIFVAGGLAVGSIDVTVPEAGEYVIGFMWWGGEAEPTPYYIRVFRETSAALIPMPIPTMPLLALSMLLMICGTGGFIITSKEEV